MWTESELNSVKIDELELELQLKTPVSQTFGCKNPEKQDNWL